MKKLKHCIAAILAAALTVTAAPAAAFADPALTGVAATPDMLTTGEPVSPSGAVSMYRLYNPNSGEHFYTASAPERDAVARAGWRYEGVGWYAPFTSHTPVYRLYNPNAGDHFYTVNSHERDSLKAAGWRYEGIGWYSADSSGQAVYREYNPNAVAGSHNYTVNASEHHSLTAHGWKDEGIAWYGANTQLLSFENDPAYASIEADVTLNGTGTGYHAKVDISSANGSNGQIAAWGINYEEGVHNLGQAFSNNTCFIVENIRDHANVGGGIGKQYIRYPGAERNVSERIRLSYYSDGTIGYYVNDRLYNRIPTSLTPPFIFTVEGSCARNGDSISALFHNVRVKAGNNSATYGTIGRWNATNNYFGLTGSVDFGVGTVRTDGQYATDGEPTYGVNMLVSGTANIPGIASDGRPYDWDSSFEAVDPTTGTTNHPLSAQIPIAQR